MDYNCYNYFKSMLYIEQTNLRNIFDCTKWESVILYIAVLVSWSIIVVMGFETSNARMRDHGSPTILATE